MTAIGVHSTRYDAVVVGAGPNGLAAAVTIARAGRSVLLVEATDRVGGGLRSDWLTEPGFVHDVCSTIHAFGPASPFLSQLPLAKHGLQWMEPAVALAHPLDGGRAAWAARSLPRTVAGLEDGGARYERLLAPIVQQWDALVPQVLAPLTRVPRHPVALARFGVPALLPSTLVGRWFRHEPTAALFAGAAAHSFLPLGRPLTSSFALMLLASLHTGGWPVARGGSQAIAYALGAYLAELGGEIRCGVPVRSLHDLPPARAVLFDLSPRQVDAIAGERMSDRWRRRAQRYRHGPGSFKIDYALDEAVPWAAAVCRDATTLHLGGTLAEIGRAEATTFSGRHPARPFVLAAQQTLTDPSRAPEGKHTLWAYCHVPNGSTVDMTAAIESQIERFAPGFRDVVRSRHTMGPAQLEAYNENYVGGDITGGAHDGAQLILRPFLSRPYRTDDPTLFLCSASTPPGGGVHGMCGHNAAEVALRTVLA